MRRVSRFARLPVRRFGQDILTAQPAELSLRVPRRAGGGVTGEPLTCLMQLVGGVRPLRIGSSKGLSGREVR
jgi:hypothetical protein